MKQTRTVCIRRHISISMDRLYMLLFCLLLRAYIHTQYVYTYTFGKMLDVITIATDINIALRRMKKK